VVVEAVQQEGVGAEQLAQGREDLDGVGRPELARALDLGQGQGPVPAGQQHLGAVGMGTTTQRRRVRHRSSSMAEP
jgi:hypothetical protein